MTSLVYLIHPDKTVDWRMVKEQIKKAGISVDEIVVVQNGKTSHELDADVDIILSENNGVAYGYNTAFRMCRGDIIARPGIDMIMPENWLKDAVNILNDFDGVSLLHANAPERIKGEKNGLKTGLLMGSIVFKRKIIEDIGYLPEKGLYGYDDVAWANEVLKKYETAIFENVTQTIEIDKKEYRDWKAKQVQQNKETIYEPAIKWGHLSGEIPETSSEKEERTI